MRTKLEINVTFPSDIPTQNVRECVSYIAIEKSTKDKYIVLVANREVIYFKDNNITFGTVEYLLQYYDVIRELKTNESYTIHGVNKD